MTRKVKIQDGVKGEIIFTLPSLELHKDYRYNDPALIACCVKGDLESISEWVDTPLKDLVFRYSLTPISKMSIQAQEMCETFKEFPKDNSRCEKLIQLYKSGSVVYPVFVKAGDPELFVMEGRHRMAAQYLLGFKQVLTFNVMKWRG